MNLHPIDQKENKDMKDLLLKASVNADLARQRVIARATQREENGDIVQTIIIIAMFVLICMVVGGILFNAIQSQANTVGECIQDANSGKCNNFKN